MPGSAPATLEQLPLKGLKHDRSGIRAAVYKFRRRVTAALLASGGGDIVPAVRVASACTYFRWHLKAEEKALLLRDALTLTEWLAVGDRATKWLEKCVDMLVALGLGKPLAARLVENERQRMAAMWDEVYNGRLDATPAAATPSPGSPADAQDQIVPPMAADAVASVVGTATANPDAAAAGKPIDRPTGSASILDPNPVSDSRDRHDSDVP